MLTSYHTLHLLATSLDETLRGKELTGAYTQERNHLVLNVGPATPSLVISCQPKSATMYLHPRQARARRNSTDVLASLPGRIVESVAIHPSDRVVTTTMSGGLRLTALCYGGTPNVLLLDTRDVVVDAFLDAKHLVGTSFHPPAAAEEDMPDIGAVDRALDSSPKLTTLEALRRGYPRLGQTLVREVLHRAAVDPVARGIDNDARMRIRAGLAEIYRALADPHPMVYVRGARRTPVALSLVPLHHLHPLTPMPFGDIHEAVRFFLARSRSAQHADAEQRELITTLTRTIERTRRTIAAVQEDLAKGNRGLEYERYGRLLLAHLDVAERGSRTIILTEGEEEYTVTLDPRLSAAANAQHYFAKAKTARTARLEASARLEQLRSHEARAAGLLKEIEQTETSEELLHLLEIRAGDFEAFGIRKGRGKAAALPPFRIFTVEGGFQVWAGKSSANNDELTLHHCRPNDLWFHARGGSGAHVVLKIGSGRGEPGRKAKEQAAGIAAYYSKMNKAGMVPVAMTERKYVRKPKGAPPGTVTIERENVIFAQPRLPEPAKTPREAKESP